MLTLYKNVCENMGKISYTHKIPTKSFFYNVNTLFLTVNCVAKEFFGPMKIYPQSLNFSPKIVEIFQALDQYEIDILTIDQV